MATTGTVAAVRAAKHRTVLVVEDEAPIRDLLRLHLSNAGYDVMLAEDAIDAGKRLLEHQQVDLIIIDAQLPYFSGIEFASTLIADTTLPPLPMILITGHEHLLLRAERLGVPCLMKPFSADTLVSLVQTSLNMPRAVVALKEAQARRRA